MKYEIKHDLDHINQNPFTNIKINKEIVAQIVAINLENIFPVETNQELTNIKKTSIKIKTHDIIELSYEISKAINK